MDFILYLELHQPLELKREPPSRVASWLDLVDWSASRRRFEEAASRCYTPLLKVLDELAPQGLRAAARVSGVLLEQAERWDRSLLEAIGGLVSRGALELVAGPYFNTPPVLPLEELVEQARVHAAKLRELFGIEARVYANPYLAYSDDIGTALSDSLGARAVLAEGAHHLLAWRAPYFVYKHPSRGIALLLRDPNLSNEVAFGLGKWLTASALAERASRAEGHVVVVGVPAETFGLAVPASSGAFEFLRWLPRELAKHPWVRFATPSEVVERYEPVDVLSAASPVSWLETKDLRPLTESPLQQASLTLLLELRERAARAGLAEAWRLLTQADLLLASRSITAAARLLKAICALRSTLAELPG